MHSFPPRRLRDALLLLLLLSLTACVYTRLLEVKNQLAEFDENFRVRVDGGHFMLDFLSPVLYDEDFTRLTHLHPSRVVTGQQEDYQWYLDFSPEPPAGQKSAMNADKIVFCMTFGADHKLRRWDFSPLFLQMAPPAFLEASIRSLGRGTILQSRNQLKVDPENLDTIATTLPDAESILASLGKPVEISKKDDLDVYVYRFLADSRAVDPDYESMRQAEAKLYIDPRTKRLAKMSSRFAGLKISIDYRKLSKTS